MAYTNNQRNGHCLDDYLCSLFTGIAKIAIIQPFDFLRYRLQSSNAETSTSISQIIKHSRSKEGLKVFLKGISITSFSVLTTSFLHFTLYQKFYRKVKKLGAIESIKSQLIKNSLAASIAGLLSGATLGVTTVPIDNVRVKLQSIQNVVSFEKKVYCYQGAFDCIKKNLKQNGIFGFWKAGSLSLLRESIGSTIYFGLFEFFKSKYHLQGDDLKLHQRLLYGAVAGGMSWTITLPIDIIKTRMIADTINPNERLYKSTTDCARKIYHSVGIKGFYAGYSLIVSRGVVVNAVVLTLFDLTRTMLEKRREAC